VRFVSALKELGCRVALDDFGAGYTSFRSLRTLGVDMVKIDGSFIQNLGARADDEATARLLENAGVAYMQGYFFGAPELALPAQAESRPA
jgi:EAL domain-containing protein (putative c-di-GMP-specific phosphodiesterase class I)